MQFCDEMMDAALDFIAGAISLQKLFDDSTLKADAASAALESRHWLGALDQCINNVVENTPVWVECLRSFVLQGQRAEELQARRRGGVWLVLRRGHAGAALGPRALGAVQVTSKSLSACTAQLMAFVNTLTSRTGTGRRVASSGAGIVDEPLGLWWGQQRFPAGRTSRLWSGSRKPRGC